MVIIYIIQLKYIIMLPAAEYCIHTCFTSVAASDIVYRKFWQWTLLLL